MKRSSISGHSFKQRLNPNVKKKDIKTFYGILALERWGIKNQLEKIALHTFDEGKFLLIGNYYFDDLKKNIYESVEIRGRLDVDDLGNDTIYTISWRPINKEKDLKRVKK